MFDGQTTRFQGYIAAYPRSGTAMVRMALHYCFGQATGSVYPEQNVSDFYRQTVGHVEDCRGWIKTHGVPAGPVYEPCCIIVRDPRCVFVSLQNFYRVRLGDRYTLAQLIRGEHPWGDWSRWVQSWVQHAPRTALWLRYEDFRPYHLRALGLEQTGEDDAMPGLDDLRAGAPSLFGRGDKVTRLNRADEALLVERHGAILSMLGYADHV